VIVIQVVEEISGMGEHVQKHESEAIEYYRVLFKKSIFKKGSPTSDAFLIRAGDSLSVEIFDKSKGKVTIGHCTAGACDIGQKLSVGNGEIEIVEKITAATFAQETNVHNSCKEKENIPNCSSTVPSIKKMSFSRGVVNRAKFDSAKPDAMKMKSIPSLSEQVEVVLDPFLTSIC
jgi:hypothetical protein